MAIFRWGHAWDAFHDLEQEVDRLLAGVSLTFQGVRFGRQYPSVNVYDVADELLITAELPGVKSEDLELTVADGVLTLRGKRSGTEGVPDERYRRQERPRGNWQRSLNLPERILEEQMSAEFNNGVLKIHLPKAPSSQPRQIQINEGSGE
ncbi:MAG: Hsp20/alpha crystallin family protein [Planctomycetaceae bacterium]